MVITATYLLVLIISFILMGSIAFVESAPISKKFTKPMLQATRNALTLILVVAIIYLCFLNFPVTLTLIVFITGIIVAMDFIFFAKKRKHQEPGTLGKNSREFFPILLLVWVIRSFIIQPYHVPSGSLEPTITPGDFIAVKQFPYGIRFPIGNFTIIKTGQPKVGDIVLFYNPVDPQLVFIKRLIGVPGDRIEYKNKILYINGVEAKQKYIGMEQDVEPQLAGFQPITVVRMEEDLNGVKHDIYIQPVGGETQDFSIIVPPNSYFMMGDNRDDSDDSRSGFGSGVLTFVPERNLIGKAFIIWMNWDSDNKRIDWKRIGKKIQ